MSRLSFAALLCLCTSPAFAAGCDGLSDLRSTNPHPQAYLVSGPDPLAFTDVMVQRCPQGGTACVTTDRLLRPGTVVIVTSRCGPNACASILGAAPNYPLISALVPTETLVPTDYSGSVWTGSWRHSIEQQIVIKPAPDDQITIEGYATWGMFDPQRVVRGGVNEGGFVATVRPNNASVAFAENSDGNRLPYDPASTNCSVRLWLLGPYLMVVDNNDCGGMNVSFTGLYAHGSFAD